MEKTSESRAPKRVTKWCRVSMGRAGREQVMKESVSWDRKYGFYPKSAGKTLGVLRRK